MKRTVCRQRWNTFFSKESAKRHFIMLGVTVLLSVWTYIALALLDDTKWVSDIFKKSKSGWEAFAQIGLAVGLAGMFGILVYWCAKLWMLKFLFKAFLTLFGWLPFVRRLDPEFKNSERGMKIRVKKLKKMIKKAPKDDPNLPQWRQEMADLAQRIEDEEFLAKTRQAEEEKEAREAEREAVREDRKEIRRRMMLNPEDDYFTVKGEVEAERGAGKWASALLAPLVFLGRILLGILKAVGYIVGSVGVPVLTPALILILASLIDMACQHNYFVESMVAIGLLVIAGCIMIIHPVLAIIRNKRN